MSSFYRLGFANTIRTARYPEGRVTLDSERRKIQDKKPPSYESCCSVAPNLPTYTEAMADFYTVPPTRDPILYDTVNPSLLFLGPRPEILTCPHCMINVITLVVRVPMSRMSVSNFLMYMLCCCFPLCCDFNGRQMKKHYCPKCYNLIGIYKRTN